MYKTNVLFCLNGSGEVLLICYLNAPDDVFLTWPQQAQATFLSHLTFTVVVVDAYREAQAAGFGTRAPGSGLDQAVLLPG